MNTLQAFIAGLDFGFLNEPQLKQLANLDRLHPVLVRCGGGRFTCPAQDAAHFIACVAGHGDYVRDVSVPAGSLERAANWTDAEDKFKVVYRAANSKAAQLTGDWKPGKLQRHPPGFDETQCGGVFDGHNVTSDADPGL